MTNLTKIQDALEGLTMSIDATSAMRASFAASDLAPAALKFLDALLPLLTGGQKH